MEVGIIDAHIRLYVLMDGDKNVLSADAVKFKLSKEHKRTLLNDLQNICRDYLIEGEAGLEDHAKNGVLRKIEKDKKARQHNMWEVKSPRHGGRIFFMIQDDGNFIVAAVDKNFLRFGKTQDQAIRRGVNRWETYLKQK